MKGLLVELDVLHVGTHKALADGASNRMGLDANDRDSNEDLLSLDLKEIRDFSIGLIVHEVGQLDVARLLELHLELPTR